MMEEFKILINESKLMKRIEEIAKQIEKDYEGKDILLVGILKGSVPFMWELAKRIKKCRVTFEFIEVSSYEGRESTRNVTLKKDIQNVEGKDILIVEDIIDTGITLEYLKKLLLEKKPNSIKIATLLSKPSRRIVEIGVDYIGFKIEDKFVIGFGLDEDQLYRNLPYIGYIE